MELGRGGRYRTGNGEGENATGVTLYSDTILRVLPEQSAPRRLYLPWGTGPNEARRLREEGWITVAGLAPVPDAAAEALRLDCGHRLEGGKIVGSARS